MFDIEDDLGGEATARLGNELPYAAHALLTARRLAAALRVQRQKRSNAERLIAGDGYVAEVEGTSEALEPLEHLEMGPLLGSSLSQAALAAFELAEPIKLPLGETGRRLQTG